MKNIVIQIAMPYDDMKTLLSSVCMSSLLACFMKKKELPKLCKLKEYRMM